LLPKAKLEKEVVVIIGGTQGLGLGGVIAVAKTGAIVVFTARDVEKAKRVQCAAVAMSNNKRIYYVECDNASMESVKRAAAELVERFDRISAVICNAAIANSSAKDVDTTSEGLNRIYANNYVGHYLMVRLLAERLTENKRGGRVIFVTGAMNSYVGAPDLQNLSFQSDSTSTKDASKSAKTRGLKSRPYGASKISCFCLAAELPRRFPNISTAILSPGVVRTNYHSSDPFYIRVAKGTTVYTHTVDQVGAVYAWLALGSIPEPGTEVPKAWPVKDHDIMTTRESESSDVNRESYSSDQRASEASYVSPLGCRFWSPDRELQFTGGIDSLTFGRPGLAQGVEVVDREYQSELWNASANLVGLEL
jgi:NAD(P)-dependent dehydrogenase (short-subunit alcohol dehydrogenase family)